MFKDTNSEKHKYTSKGAKYMGKNFLHMLNVNKIILSRAAAKKSRVCFQFNAGLSVFLVDLTFSFSFS